MKPWNERWHAQNFEVYLDTGEGHIHPVLWQPIYQPESDVEPMKARARLAAAAPELYRALEACVEFMGASDRPTSETEHQARAALRKARGEA